MAELELAPTIELVEMSGIKTRLWRGYTEDGFFEVSAFIALLAVEDDDGVSEHPRYPLTEPPSISLAVSAGATLQPTDELVEMGNGVKARIWRGHLHDGRVAEAYIALIKVADLDGRDLELHPLTDLKGIGDA